MDTNTNPPFLGPTQPVYPPLLQLLRITPSVVAGPSGFAQFGGSSVPGPTLYVAFVEQLRSDGSLLPRDREPCLADDVNGLGLGALITAGQQFFLGRLAGAWTGLPVYEVVGTPPPPSGPSFSGCFLWLETSLTPVNNTSNTVEWDHLKYDTDNYVTGSGPWGSVALPFFGSYAINCQLLWVDTSYALPFLLSASITIGNGAPALLVNNAVNTVSGGSFNNNVNIISGVITVSGHTLGSLGVNAQPNTASGSGLVLGSSSADIYTYLSVQYLGSPY